jgi:hypothetical protein
MAGLEQIVNIVRCADDVAISFGESMLSSSWKAILQRIQSSQRGALRYIGLECALDEALQQVQEIADVRRVTTITDMRLNER